MANLKSFKCFGCWDLLAAIYQILVTSAIAMVSLHFQLRNGKPDGTYRTPQFLFTFILTVAAVVIYLNFRQLFAARKLMKAGNNNERAGERTGIQINWPFWNGATCVVSMIWYLCVITMFLKYDFTLACIGILLMLIAGARFLLARALYKKLDEDKREDEIPPMEL